LAAPRAEKPLAFRLLDDNCGGYAAEA